MSTYLLLPTHQGGITASFRTMLYWECHARYSAMVGELAGLLIRVPAIRNIT
jgi:hypothetical protein